MRKVIEKIDILNFLYNKVEAEAKEISEYFNISSSTLHRILTQLKDDSLISIQKDKIVCIAFTFFSYNNTAREIIKNKIAYKAVQLINDGDTICLAGSSSTVSLMIPFIVLLKKNISIISNTIPVLQSYLALYHWAVLHNITLLSIGGTIPNNRYSFGGEYADHIISHYHPQKTFISTQGATAKGLYVDSPNEHYIEKKILSSTPENYILADSFKFTNKKLYKWAEWQNFKGLITDYKPDFSFPPGFEYMHACQEIVF